MKKAITLLLLVIIAVGAYVFMNSETTFEKYVTIEHTTVYYSGTPSISDAKNLATYLQNEFQFNTDTTVYLTGTDNGYNINITSNYNNPEQITEPTRFYLHLLASRISQDLFNTQPVTLKIVSEEGKDLYTTNSEYFYTQSGEIRVYYTNGLSTEAQHLADYAESLVGADYEWDLILTRNGNYIVYALTGKTSPQQFSDDMKQSYQNMATQLVDVLGGPVDLVTTDPSGNPLLTFQG